MSPVGHCYYLAREKGSTLFSVGLLRVFSPSLFVYLPLGYSVISARPGQLCFLSLDTTFSTRLHVQKVKTQISLRIRLKQIWIHGYHRVLCEDSDQTEPMRRLI